MSVLPVLISFAISGLAHADSREDAIIALAEGRQARAIQLLADGVSAGGADARAGAVAAEPVAGGANEQQPPAA